MSSHTQMTLIREFENASERLFMQNLIPGTTHLCTGQEAVAVGFAAAMTPADRSTYTYRSHGHVLSRGMDPEVAFAEMMGRVSGCNRGKGGSMHLTDASLGLHGSFAIVGAGLPVAVGLGRAAQLRGDPSVSVVFFGDGATNIGAFHESMNLAAVWHAPVVFVCENNLYGEYTPLAQTTPVEDLAVRASAYAMHAEIVDGNDVEAVYTAACAALEQARAGRGPIFVECKTYRFVGHSKTDPAKYRPEGELERWRERDPLLVSRRRLLERSEADEETLARLDDEIRADIAAAVERAAGAAWPAAEELLTDVYA
jgi:pyruvate dehydrogenase E1 component alpha subunit